MDINTVITYSGVVVRHHAEIADLRYAQVNISVIGVVSQFYEWTVHRLVLRGTKQLINWTCFRTTEFVSMNHSPIHPTIHESSCRYLTHSSIHPSIHPSIQQFMNLPVDTSLTHPSIHPSIHPTIHESSCRYFTHSSIHPSIHPSNNSWIFL